MTPMQKLIEYARSRYSDEMNPDLKDVIEKSYELLQYEDDYVKKRIELAYDHGYETGVRYNTQKQYDS